MSTDNDRLLERIGEGDTLRALNELSGGGDGGSTRLATNRALYKPAGEESVEQVRMAEQEHRAHMADLQGRDRMTTLYNLGCFALMQDDVVEARLRFAEVLELEPGNLLARHNMAYAHELLAETDDARREYEAVLAQRPDVGLTRLNLAQLKLQEADYEAGLADLEALHGENPANLGVLLYLCRGLLLRATRHDLERVLELLDASAEVERFVDLQECRAYARYLIGDLEAAERGFRQLLEGGEDNAFALVGLIKVLGQRSDFAGIEPLAERYQALGHSEACAALLTVLQAP